MEVNQERRTLEYKFSQRDNLYRLNSLFTNAVRFAITSNSDDKINCDYAVCKNTDYSIKNIFDSIPRKTVNNDKFNVVMIVPTGIAAEVGGDSGDGGTAARLLGFVADTLITHPNVVNGADINEMTDNTLYVEGSVLNRFMLGTVGLQRTRGNRILLLIDPHKDEVLINLAVNAASAMRSTLGCNIDVALLSDVPTYESFYDEKGMAIGKVKRMEKILSVIEKYKTAYDSFALETVLQGMDFSVMDEYFSDKLNVNPWGGIEAMITHTISNVLDVSVAHAPMLISKKELSYAYGIVDPRKSAETLSKTELLCVLKGMHRTPKIITEPTLGDGSLTNSDIHALVTPDRCISLPIIAALDQNIPVITVDDTRNLMQNDLSKLPWRDGQFFRVRNYTEAAGVLTCLKNSIDPNSLKRPMDRTKIIKE